MSRNAFRDTPKYGCGGHYSSVCITKITKNYPVALHESSLPAGLTSVWLSNVNPLGKQGNLKEPITAFEVILKP